MKPSVSIILNLLFVQQIYSQNLADTTIHIKTVEVVENKIPEAYKTTTFDSIIKSQAENLAELINNNSSVFIKSYGAGSLASISFRGTGASHTQVLWNGVSLNSPMNGQIDFSLYPILFFDDAALHYGASGLIDGSGSLGGSVVLNNQETFNTKTTTSFNQTIGSFNNYTSAIKIKTGNKKWFYETQLYGKSAKNNFEYANISLAENPKEKLKNAQVNQYGLQQAVYKKLKNGSIGARVWYFNSERQLPTILTKTQATEETQQDESLRILIELKGLKNKLQYQASSALVNDHLIYENKTTNIYSKNKSYLFDNNIITTIYLNKNLKLINNLNLKYEKAIADGFTTNHQRIRANLLFGASKDFKKLSINLFNRMILVGKEFQAFTPSFGTQYKLLNKEELYLKANAGFNYHYPTFNDLYWNPGGNEDLKPEFAKMIEGGVSYAKSIKKVNLTTEVTAFHSYVDDWIIWLPTEFGFWSPTNLREVKNEGIETNLTASTNINKWKVKGMLNYAYTKSTNLKAKNSNDNSVNKQLLYVPYHKLNGTLQGHYKSIYLSYNYNYTGKRFITTDNDWYLPAHFLSDISLAKQFKITLTLSATVSFKVKNIFNQEFQSIANRPMPGRNYLLSITIHLN